MKKAILITLLGVLKILAILIALLAVFLVGCNLSNQRLAKKMIEKYSEDQNYVAFIGEIIEIDDNNVVIKCEELHDYISYEDEICEYYIYSDEVVELQIGEEIQFTTVPFHFYDGHKLPIVELKIDGKTLLSFEEGKENLIDWVNINFNK